MSLGLFLLDRYIDIGICIDTGIDIGIGIHIRIHR